MAKYIIKIWTTTLCLFTNGEDNTVHCVSKWTLYSYTPHIVKTHSLPETVEYICGFGSSICPCVWKHRNHRKEHTEKETCAMEGATLWLENFLESHVKPDTRVQSITKGCWT